MSLSQKAVNILTAIERQVAEAEEVPDPNRTYVMHQVNRIGAENNNPRFVVTTICVPGNNDRPATVSTVEVENPDLIQLYDELF